MFVSIGHPMRDGQPTVSSLLVAVTMETRTQAPSSRVARERAVLVKNSTDSIAKPMCPVKDQ